MDAENAEKQKKLRISKQEHINRIFLNFFHSLNYLNIITFLKYTKQGNFHDLNEKLGLSLVISRYLKNFLKTTEKAKLNPRE